MINKSAFIVFLFFCLCSIHISAQSLSGKIIDAETNEPIPYATVYIEGTTIGTTSNVNGEFLLKFKIQPESVVISHVSYDLKIYRILESVQSELRIKLTPKKNEIEEIKVSDKSMREKNLNIFRMNFLGTDSWGLQAKIENENALFFYNEYDSITVAAPKKHTPNSSTNLHEAMLLEKDSTRIRFLSKSRLIAQSTEPLIVTLPSLGYKIHVDLIEFVYEYAFRGKCYYKGSFYFNELTPKNNREMKKYTKNRLKVYYNSDLHFLRSLYTKELAKNGFNVLQAIKTEYDDEKLNPINLQKSSLYAMNSTMQLVGLNGTHLYILYYQKRGKPQDLSQVKGRFPIQSEIYIQSDTCIIRSDGTTYDYALSFTPVMGSKKVGAFLPSDYLP